MFRKAGVKFLLAISIAVALVLGIGDFLLAG